MTKEVEVLTEIIIDKHLSEVAAYSTNPDNATEWCDQVKWVERQTESALAVGSQVTFITDVMGKDTAYTYRYTKFAPEDQLIMKTEEGLFPVETTYAWFEIGQNQTLMTLRNISQPTGLSRWLSPLMTLMVKRTNKKGLLKIKQILESR